MKLCFPTVAWECLHFLGHIFMWQGHVLEQQLLGSMLQRTQLWSPLMLTEKD